MGFSYGSIEALIASRELTERMECDATFGQIVSIFRAKSRIHRLPVLELPRLGLGAWQALRFRADGVPESLLAAPIGEVEAGCSIWCGSEGGSPLSKVAGLLSSLALPAQLRFIDPDSGEPISRDEAITTTRDVVRISRATSANLAVAKAARAAGKIRRVRIGSAMARAGNFRSLRRHLRHELVVRGDMIVVTSKPNPGPRRRSSRVVTAIRPEQREHN